MDRVEATPARGVVADNTRWDDAAQTWLRKVIEQQPVLVQISAAKRLRDQAEQRAREAGEEVVTEQYVKRAGLELGLGEPA
jgi:chlorophyllide a reductase subunit Z